MNRKPFFDKLHATLFEKGMTQRQVAGIELILDAWEAFDPHAPREFVAYSLATAYWETARTMQPIAEYGRGRGRKYGVPAGPYNKIYYGRGYVQLTWLFNYEKADKELHARKLLDTKLDLVRDPDLVMVEGVAANILLLGMVEGWFTGRKLSHYFGNGKADWIGARRIINGTDRAKEIAVIGKQFYAALNASATIAKPPAQITVKDLRTAGSETIRGSDKAQTGTVGNVASTAVIVESLRQVKDLSNQAKEAAETAVQATTSVASATAWAQANWPLILLALGVLAFIYFNWSTWAGATLAKRARLREARAGLNLSRLG